MPDLKKKKKKKHRCMFGKKKHTHIQSA